MDLQGQAIAILSLKDSPGISFSSPVSCHHLQRRSDLLPKLHFGLPLTITTPRFQVRFPAAVLTGDLSQVCFCLCHRARA
ncbi:hypothetical protein L1987_47792 [Smallanthus sonchifolius]|uniref:Uncharacterized protein n=1 Tax=Smallanthus sonchifolius TaxID=185202 RepID=A0ACB9FQ10_9ASTR|nr:hypothetical protein L1987_47792 [Smallanthus sonchifolius]